MSRLFTPMKLGHVELQNRVALAPLTRNRADDDGVLLPMAKLYYTQRACVPGTLLISEATPVSRRAKGLSNVPGIWTDAQVAAWKDVVDAVHERGCPMFCQLWHGGRACKLEVVTAVNPDVAPERLVLAPSAMRIDEEHAMPVAMTEEEIAETIADFATAARRAVEEAGFDGVEIHGANGYLPDTFLQDVSNARTDRWGGSIEARSLFPLEVARAVVAAVGASRLGYRLSPFSRFQSMGMEHPHAQFEHVARGLKALGLAYLHVIDSRTDHQGEDKITSGGIDCAFLVKLWDNMSPVLLAGGFTPELAKRAVDETYKDYHVAIAFGRRFISNPDLPFRIRDGIELTKYKREYFYSPLTPIGYIDYEFSAKFVAKHPDRVVPSRS